MSRLAAASSPYLRQHAGNPVPWWPWCDEAFAEARRRDVPLLVSIGYSTCHWCHVMAHECFEDPPTAAAMARDLVCIKVDREEHPEVDAIYMDAVQALHGHGGWPLNAFVDHQGRPFHAVTYLPRQPWTALVARLGELWRDDRARLLGHAGQLAEWLRREDAGTAGGSLPADLADRLERDLTARFDDEHPAWSWTEAGAPRFPPHQLLALAIDHGPAPLRAQAAAILEAMQDSGLHDRVGGGFHRYSVDRIWRVPHFEKMLYDQGQLLGVYARAAVRLGRPDFLATAEGIAGYLERDLRIDRDGFQGYAAAEDADDPGGEGSFYAWPPDELERILGADGRRLAMEWHLSPGHAETGPSGHREPITAHIPHPRGAGPVDPARRAAWAACHETLRQARSRRPRPGLDDKVISEWNGYALDGLAWLARASGSERWARCTADLASALRHRLDDAGFLRLPGRPALAADYGACAAGFAAAFDALGDPTLVDTAVRLLDEADARLRAPDGGFFTSPAGRTDLLRRGREIADNAWPSAPGSLALAATRAAAITGTPRWRSLAEEVLAASAGTVGQAPAACASLLAVQGSLAKGRRTCGSDRPDLLALARRACLPALACLPASAAGTRGWEASPPPPDAAQLCLGDRCLAPATTAETLAAQLAAAG